MRRSSWRQRFQETGEAEGGIKNTSGLFKLPRASPSPGPSAGPRGRLRFSFSSHQVDEAPSETLPKGPESKEFVCKASQLKETGALLSCVEMFQPFFFPSKKKTFCTSSHICRVVFPLGHFHSFSRSLGASRRGRGHACLRAASVGSASRPTLAPLLSLSAILPPPPVAALD